MNARSIAISRGRSAPNQHFSTARSADPRLEALVAETLKAGISSARRSRILGDPANVHRLDSKELNGPRALSPVCC